MARVQQQRHVASGLAGLVGQSRHGGLANQLLASEAISNTHAPACHRHVHLAALQALPCAICSYILAPLPVPWLPQDVVEAWETSASSGACMVL
jgi:hypothetical protein